MAKTVCLLQHHLYLDFHSAASAWFGWRICRNGPHYIWIRVPHYVLVSWIFNTMEKMCESSEDPFENFINDVPMSALCRTIEIDLKDMLDEKDLPEKVLPIKGGLM